VWPWQGVQWNLAFIGFCIYSVTIITYIAPLGQVGMIIALIGLLLGRDRIRFPLPLVFFAAYYLYATATWPMSSYAGLVKEELLTFGRVALIFLVGINVLMERTRLRFYLFLYLGAFALYPVRGAIFNQFLYHAAELGRIAWNLTFSNPNDLAALLLFPLGLSAGFLYTERHKYVRWAALAGLGLISLIVFLTQSRGAILALTAFGLLVFARQKNKLRTLPVIAGIGLVIALFAPDSVWTRLKNLRQATGSGELKAADDFGSAEQRFEIWKIAGTIWQRHPMTGVGLGAYPYEHWRVSRSGAETFKRTARGGRDAHSTYLTALAETGVPGFLFFMGIFLAMYLFAQRVRKLIKTTDPDAERQIFFAQAAFVAYGVAGLFGSWTQVAFTYINVAILYCISHVALEKHRARQMAARYATRLR
jgi:O-antigen ligase